MCVYIYIHLKDCRVRGRAFLFLLSTISTCLSDTKIDISLAITVESSPLHIASSWTGLEPGIPVFQEQVTNHKSFFKDLLEQCF